MLSLSGSRVKLLVVRSFEKIKRADVESEWITSRTAKITPKVDGVMDNTIGWLVG